MLRLTAVFFIWIASTALALEDADADYDAELHEAYVAAWNEADHQGRGLLARAQRERKEYRAAVRATAPAHARAVSSQGER